MNAVLDGDSFSVLFQSAEQNRASAVKLAPPSLCFDHCDQSHSVIFIAHVLNTC